MIKHHNPIISTFLHHVPTTFMYLSKQHLTAIKAQNKEGILPVATLSIALYVLRRSMSAIDVAPEVKILSSAL